MNNAAERWREALGGRDSNLALGGRASNLAGKVAKILDLEPEKPPTQWIAINIGADEGVGMGDEFEVMAPEPMELFDPEHTKDGAPDSPPAKLGELEVVKSVYVVRGVRRRFALLARVAGTGWAYHLPVYPLDIARRMGRPRETGYDAPKPLPPPVRRGPFWARVFSARRP